MFDLVGSSGHGGIGRRKGLKIPRCASAVPVRPRLPAPRDLTAPGVVGGGRERTLTIDPQAGRDVDRVERADHTMPAWLQVTGLP